MSMTIDPSNINTAREVKAYSDFKQIKGYVDKAEEEMKKMDNDDTVDLSPAKGNVAVIDNTHITSSSSVEATATLTYDVSSGEVRKLDMETKDEDSQMGCSDTVTCHISYTDQGDKGVYDFKKRDHKHDHLSEMTDNSSLHYTYTIRKDTGVITFEDLPYNS